VPFCFVPVEALVAGEGSFCWGKGEGDGDMVKCPVVWERSPVCECCSSLFVKGQVDDRGSVIVRWYTGVGSAGVSEAEFRCSAYVYEILGPD